MSARVLSTTAPSRSIWLYGDSSSRPPLGLGFLVLLGAVLFVLLMFLLRLRLFVFLRFVAGAVEFGGRRGGFDRGRRRGFVAGLDAFAGDGFDRVLGFQAAFHAGVVDVLQFVSVLADQGIAGEEEDVFAAFGCVGEERGVLALAGRDQIDAAFVEGGVGGAAFFAAATKVLA